MSKITALLNSCAAVIALSVAVPPAANAAVFSFASSGTITSGYDSTGFFGAVGDLTGKTFSQVITLDPTAYNNIIDIGNGATEYYGTLTGIATDTVTINGVARAFTWNLSLPNYGESILNSNYWQMYQYLKGYTTDGSYLESMVMLTSDRVSSSYFCLANLQNNGSVFFSGYSINAPVPEPETYAMLLAGLGLLGFTARRRKTLVA